MINRSFRRANLISPFGPGAISITTSGAALMTAGLDAWFQFEGQDFDETEFRIGEWRLQKQLGVDYFMLPPDHRQPFNNQFGTSQNKQNMNLTVPVLRFPTWFVCTNQACGRLHKLSLTSPDNPSCPECQTKKKHKTPMTQVQFIAYCEDGHVQDFPWNEWVHRSATPHCSGRLRLKGSGSSTLASRTVSCDICGNSRSLGNILRGASSSGENTGETEYSFLTQRLDSSGEKYLCQGQRPWLGDGARDNCDRSLQGSLRGATNVYFPATRSSIYVPSNEKEIPKELIHLLEAGPVHTTLGLYKQTFGEIGNQFVKLLRNAHKKELASYTDEQILDAMNFFEVPPIPPTSSILDTAETSFRRLEFDTLSYEIDEREILVKAGHLKNVDSSASALLSKINLVERLTETRVFNGFSRVTPKDNLSNKDRDMLISHRKQEYGKRWLPAYQVFGEGIFIEVDEARLREWEQRPEVQRRAESLDSRVRVLRSRRSQEPKPITPRFLLLHTTAHLLINQLVFHSGYNSASLRERLYVSEDIESPMAGILIYTASGDSDGTLGGLVRLGDPDRLCAILTDAVRSATWCSGDPVCMEMGASGGQGPDSCNLAACHSCSLLPETSCEEFNRYLDRWMVVGDASNPSSGFFSELLMT